MNFQRLMHQKEKLLEKAVEKNAADMAANIDGAKEAADEAPAILRKHGFACTGSLQDPSKVLPIFLIQP